MDHDGARPQAGPDFIGAGFTRRVKAGWERRRFAAYRIVLPLSAAAVLLADFVDPVRDISTDSLVLAGGILVAWALLLRAGPGRLFLLERAGFVLLGVFLVLQEYAALFGAPEMSVERHTVVVSWLMVFYVLIYFLFEPRTAQPVAWGVWIITLLAGILYAVAHGAGLREASVLLQAYLAGAAMIAILSRVVWTRLQLVRAQEEIRQYGQLAATDELTGLANRRFLSTGPARCCRGALPETGRARFCLLT